MKQDHHLYLNRIVSKIDLRKYCFRIYTVKLNNSEQHVAFAVGDVVKLVNHDSSPAIGFGTVSQKTTGLNAEIVIDIEPVTSTLNVGATSGEVKGYISIRNIFTIAKGRVGVI